MSQSNRESSMHHALLRIVSKVPYRLRGAIKKDVKGIQKALSLPAEDLCCDRRTLRKRHDDPGRLAFQSSMRARTAERKGYRVEFRDGFKPVDCTLADAAKLVRRSENSLRVLLAKHAGTWHTTVDDRIITVSRLSSSSDPGPPLAA